MKKARRSIDFRTVLCLGVGVELVSIDGRAVQKRTAQCTWES